MTAARRALRGAAGMTDRSCSLQRMVRSTVDWSGASARSLRLVCAGRDGARSDSVYAAFMALCHSTGSSGV